jgi:hypothetical protein
MPDSIELHFVAVQLFGQLTTLYELWESNIINWEEEGGKSQCCALLRLEGSIYLIRRTLFLTDADKCSGRTVLL